jgi:hypothetical protein
MYSFFAAVLSILAVDISNSLPTGSFTILFSVEDDTDVDEQAAAEADSVHMYAGQPTLVTLVFKNGYNLSADVAPSNGVIALAIPRTVDDTGCATNVGEGGADSWGEWTFKQAYRSFMYGGEALQAIQGYLKAPQAGWFTVCYSTDGSFDLDHAAYTEIMANVSGIAKDCGTKDCLAETTVLNCSMSRDFAEDNWCEQEILNVDHYIGPEVQVTTAAQTNVLYPGYGLATGILYGDDKSKGCPPTDADPETFSNVTRARAHNATVVSLYLNETFRIPTVDNAPFVGKTVNLCSCPGWNQLGRSDCTDKKHFTQDVGVVRLYASAICSDSDCALPYSGILKGLPFLVKIACPPGACSYNVRSEVKIVDPDGGCQQQRSQVFLTRECGRPCLEYGGGGQDYKEFPRPASHNERGNARYVYELNIISAKFADVCLCHGHCYNDENWFRAGRIRVQGPVWASNTSYAVGSEMISMVNKTGSLALEKRDLGIFGLTDASTVYLSLFDPKCDRDDAYRTPLFNSTLDYSGKPTILAYTREDNLMEVTKAGMYSVCYCGKPDGLGCDSGGYLITLDTMVIRGPAQDLDLWVTTETMFMLEYNAWNADKRDFVHFQPFGKRCGDIDVTDRNDENPVVKNGIRIKCGGGPTQMAKCAMARGLSVSLLQTTNVPVRSMRRSGGKIYILDIIAVPPLPGKDLWTAEIEFNGDPGLEDGDVITLGKSIVANSTSTEAEGIVAQVRGLQQLPTGGSIMRGTIVRETGNYSRWAIDGWQLRDIDLFVNESKVEEFDRYTLELISREWVKRGGFSRRSKATVTQPLWATRAENLRVCWSYDNFDYNAFVGHVRVTEPARGRAKAHVVEGVGGGAQNSVILHYQTGDTDFGVVKGRSSLRIRIREAAVLELYKGGLRAKDREKIKSKEAVYDGEHTHVLCAQLFAEMWSSNAPLTPVGCMYTSVTNQMREVVLVFQPRDGIRANSDYYFVMHAAVNGDTQIDVLAMHDIDLYPYVALEVANATVLGPVGEAGRVQMNSGPDVTHWSVLESPAHPRTTQSLLSLRFGLSETAPLIVGSVLRLVVRPFTNWDLEPETQFSTSINETINKVKLTCNTTYLPILDKTPFIDLKISKVNLSWAEQKSDHVSFSPLPYDVNLSYGFSAPTSGFFPTPFHFVIMNLTDGRGHDMADLAFVNSSFPAPFNLAQIVMKAGPSNLNNAPFVSLTDKIALSVRLFAPMRSAQGDRGVHLGAGRADIVFIVGAGLECVSAEESDPGMAILLPRNPEGRGRLVEGDWTFKGRECRFSLHENETIFYGEERWVKIAISHPPLPQSVTAPDTTWKLVASVETPPVITDYTHRYNVSCNVTNSSNGSNGSNVTPECFKEEIRRKGMGDIVAFHDDFHTNISAGYAARIATLSIITRAVVQQTHESAPAQWVRIFFQGVDDTVDDVQIAVSIPLLFVFPPDCEIRDLDPQYYWYYGIEAPQLDRLKDMGKCRASEVEREEGYPAAMNRAAFPVAEVMAGVTYGFEIHVEESGGPWATGWRVAVLSAGEEVAATMHPIGISYNDGISFPHSVDPPIEEKSFGLYPATIPGTLKYEPKTYAMTRVGMRIKFDVLQFPTAEVTSLRLTAPFGFAWEDPSNDYFDPKGSRSTRMFPGVPGLVTGHPNQLAWPAIALDPVELYGFTLYAVMPKSTPNMASNSFTLELGYMEYDAAERYCGKVFDGSVLKILYEPRIWMHTPVVMEKTWITIQIGVHTMVGLFEGIIITGEEGTERIELTCPETEADYVTKDLELDYIGRKNAFRGQLFEDVIVIKPLPMTECHSFVDENNLRPKVILVVINDLIRRGVYEWTLPIMAPEPTVAHWAIATNKEVLGALPPILDQKLYINSFEVYTPLADFFYIPVFDPNVIKLTGVDNRPTMNTALFFSITPSSAQTLQDSVWVRAPRGFIFKPDCMDHLVTEIYSVFGEFRYWDDYFTEWPDGRRPIRCVGDYNYANITLDNRKKPLKKKLAYIFRIGVRNPEFTPKDNVFHLGFGDAASIPAPGYDLWMFHNTSLTYVTGMKKVAGDDIPNFITVKLSPTNPVLSAPDMRGGGVILNAPPGFEFNLEANLTNDETGEAFTFIPFLETPNVLILQFTNTTGEQILDRKTSYTLFAEVFNPKKVQKAIPWTIESFNPEGKDTIRVDAEGYPYTFRVFTPIRENLVDFQWLPGFDVVEALNWTISNPKNDDRGRARVKVLISINMATVEDATHATIQLPRGAIFDQCPLACECSDEDDCKGLFPLPPKPDDADEDDDQLWADMYIHIKNAKYTPIDETTNVFRIDVGLAPPPPPEPEEGEEEEGAEVPPPSSQVEPVFASARARSWKIVPRLLDVVVYPMEGATAAGSTSVLNIQFTPVHDAQFLTVVTLLPIEGVDFSRAYCQLGCETIVPYLGTGNHSGRNASFYTYLDMYENQRVNMELANVVLGPVGGNARFVLTSSSFNEELLMWEREDESDERVGFYPGNLNADEWRLRNEWFFEEDESPVLRALPPRRDEPFTLEAVMNATIDANWLEITCEALDGEGSFADLVRWNGPVVLNRQEFGRPGALGDSIDLVPGEASHLRVPLLRSEDCRLLVQAFRYNDVGQRTLTGTSDFKPQMILSDRIKGATVTAERSPPRSLTRVTLSSKVEENVTLIAAPGFRYTDDACVELVDLKCMRIPIPEIAGGPVNNTEAMYVYGTGVKSGVFRVIGPRDPGRLPWFLLTDNAARWEQLRGVKVPKMPSRLTAPAIPSLPNARVTVEFTLKGVLADPVLRASRGYRLNGGVLILRVPDGYEPVGENDGSCSDVDLDFIDETCKISGNEFRVTMPERKFEEGDYTLAVRCNIAPKTPRKNIFVIRMETYDGVGVAEAMLDGPSLVDFKLELPRLKWSIQANPGPVPVSISVRAPVAIPIRLLSAIQYELPPGFRHRILEPENVEAPNIPFDAYDLDVSDPRLVKLVLIKEAFLEDLLKVYFEVTVPDSIAEGRNVWKVQFLSDFDELVSFAIPGFRIGQMPSDWVPSIARLATIFIFMAWSC